MKFKHVKWMIKYYWKTGNTGYMDCESYADSLAMLRKFRDGGWRPDIVRVQILKTTTVTLVAKETKRG